MISHIKIYREQFIYKCIYIHTIFSNMFSIAYIYIFVSTCSFLNVYICIDLQHVTNLSGLSMAG